MNSSGIKAVILGGCMTFVLFFSHLSLAAQDNNPFQGIWNAITGLQQQINSIQTTPGPMGPQGPKGDTGLQGPSGEPGRQGIQGEAGSSVGPEIKSIVFALNRPQPFQTEPVDVSGFSKMTVTVGTTGFIVNYALLIEVNGEWIEQIRIRCDGGQECPVTTIPIISNSYRLSTGTASGNITAAAVLEKSAVLE